MGVRSLFFRLITWRGRQEVHGLPVWAPLSSRDLKAVIVRRLGESLNLLSVYSPCRYARVQRSLSGFLVYGTVGARASYQPEPRLCRLGESFVLDPVTAPSSIVATIVHEATHGWLFDLGIGYDEPIRFRVEQICIRAALEVARQLPDGKAEVDRCERQLTLDAVAFSDDSYFRGVLQNLRDLGCPEWLVRIFERLIWFRFRRKRVGKA